MVTPCIDLRYKVQKDLILFQVCFTQRFDGKQILVPEGML